MYRYGVLVLALLALAAVLASVHAAAQTTPLEPCFEPTASWVPVSPDPGDVVKVTFWPCEGGSHSYAVRFYGAESGYRLLEAGTFEGYEYSVSVTLPQERGCVELVLDDVVIARFPVGLADCEEQAPIPEPPDVTVTTTTALVDLGDMDFRKLAILAGAGAIVIVGLAMALARRG